MGCDIHLYVERKENGKWVPGDHWVKDEDDDNPSRLRVSYDDQLYTGRNYSLFAILADVRNGRGFAGIKTGEGFIPIAKPRGVPDDCSAEYRQEVEAWDSDGHSHSHFTVAELMAYDWTQVSHLQGWVDIHNFEEFERWRKRRQEGPDDYCGMITGDAIRHVSNDDMRAMVKVVTDEKVYGDKFKQRLSEVGAHCYTLVEWKSPYFKCAKEFLSESLPKLWRFGKPEDVRIVFFFDN